MARNIYCKTCGDKCPALPPQDVEDGWRERRLWQRVKKPAEHFIRVGGERFDLATLHCDLCNTVIKDGEEAMLQTMWHDSSHEISEWENEYKFEKLRPLIMDDQQRETIRGVVAYAEKHVLTADEIFSIAAGQKPPAGENENRVCVIPVGFVCAFSLEIQPAAGLCRHLSISVLGDGEAPNEHAVQMLASEFGFCGSFRDWQIYLERIAADKVAVNVLQLADNRN